MCTVYEFPKQLKLPREMEENLQTMAKEYVDLLDDSMGYFVDEDTTEEDYQKITDLILTAYLQGIAKAIDELD